MPNTKEFENEFITIKVSLISRYYIKLLAKRNKKKMYEYLEELLEKEFHNTFTRKAKNESTEKESCEEKESESCISEKKVTETLVNNSSCQI